MPLPQIMAIGIEAPSNALSAFRDNLAPSKSNEYREHGLPRALRPGTCWCRRRKVRGASALDTEAKLSINFLPNAVYSPLACIQLTLQTARVAGMPIDRLIFEFTENEQMGSPEHVSSIIDTYKGIGFKVAIDDFGAGHSGLGMFARFVPDEIKLDMELVRDVDRDPRRQAIIRGVVQMCTELDTLVIAEGIETASEAGALRDLGVRYHQGFWYAKPALNALPSVPNGQSPDEHV